MNVEEFKKLVEEELEKRLNMKFEVCENCDCSFEFSDFDVRCFTEDDNLFNVILVFVSDCFDDEYDECLKQRSKSDCDILFKREYVEWVSFHYDENDFDSVDDVKKYVDEFFEKTVSSVESTILVYILLDNSFERVREHVELIHMINKNRGDEQ